MNILTLQCHFIIIVCIYVRVHAKKFSEGDKPAWAKKDIRDYNDVDVERLLDQWDEDDEPLEPDELPEHLRQQPAIDFSKIDTTNPENLLKLSKKGKTLMMFVQTLDSLTRKATDDIVKLWQGALWNNHITVETYVVDDNRALFVFKDGAYAWEAKDYLIEQRECKSVEIENKKYPGKYTEGKKKLPDEL